MAQSSINSYCNEWNFLFSGSSDVVLLDNLKRVCIEGRLQGSRFRSICWRLLLNCLPSAKSNWDDAISKWRAQFTDLKNKYDVDPHRSLGTPSDLQYNNPLSLDAKNPWQQYFDDAELRACIKQDVERTFPELEYFQSQSVREMMITILFVYARENPHIAYKQGMHEILGPLIFVLFFDHETFEHASKEGGFEVLDSESRRFLTLLTNENYLEHDAYAMFTQIMLIIQPWYYFADEHQPPQEENKSPKKTSSANAIQNIFPQPFARVQDIGHSSVLVRKLNWIGDNLVKHSDPQLYHHLEKLDIPPQIYGIRWLRLLFGREFPIQDLLFLWDAIFADGPPFTLVDYVFVAMLVFIRDLLLDCDYTGCLHYLMRYPPVTDVNRLLAVALHLQNPQKHPKPLITSMQMNFSTITVTGRPHPNMQRQAEIAASRLPAGTFSEDSPSFGASMNKTLGLTIQKLNKAGAAVVDGILEPSGNLSSRIEIPVVNSVDVKKPTQRQQQAQRPQQTQQRSGSLKGQQRHNGVPNAAASVHRSASPASGAIGGNKSIGTRQESLLSEEEVELLKEQISCLQMRLSDVEQTAHLVADKLVGCADLLSNRMTSLNVSAEDDAFKTLVHMRQLCRVLKGGDNAGVLPLDGSSDGAGINLGSPPSFAISSGVVTDTRSPISMVMDGLNSPVEIGNDATRTLPDFESSQVRIGTAAKSQHQQHQSIVQRPANRNTPISRPQQHQQNVRTGSGGGARQKVGPSSTGPVELGPKLSAENELKEIFRPKAAVASSANE